MSVQQLDYPGAKILMEIETQVEAAFRIHACEKEPWTVAMIERMQPGDVLYDIGANVGSYTLVAAARGLSVVAIEPGYENYSRLCHNLAMNVDPGQGLDPPQSWLRRVVAIHGALADKNGLAWLDFSDLRAGAGSHVFGSPQPLKFHRQPVATWALDDLVFALGLVAPTHIKIDVDGAEMLVLAGAHRTLQGGPWPEGVEPHASPRELLIEIELEREREIVETLTGMGWRASERYAERNGKQIPNICYGLFTRADA